MKIFRNFDWVLLLLTLGIGSFGLIILKSIVPELFFQQLLWFGLSLILFFIFSQINYQSYRHLTWIFYLFSVGFLILTLIFGQVSRGSARWFGVGEARLQPSEIVKPLLILFFAAFFSQEENLSLKRALYSLLLMIIPVSLIFLEPDLGSSLVVIAFWLGMILAKGIKAEWLIGAFTFCLLFFPLAWHFLKDYQKQRIYTFLNPQMDPLNSGFNVIQSMIAVGSGQFLGRGLGRGTQSHLRFLPERHTDFIFASLSEEMGFLGTFLLLALFFFLLWRLLNLAKNASDQFASLIYIGVFSLLFCQIIINLGMNIGILPVTGITLPLVSYGRSSLTAIIVTLGIAAGINRGREDKQMVEIR